MTLESDAKLEEKLTCGLENDNEKLGVGRQNWEFYGELLSKVENVWA